MTTRTNTAKWTGTRWRIDVQKDGPARAFTAPHRAALGSVKQMPRLTSGCKPV